MMLFSSMPVAHNLLRYIIATVESGYQVHMESFAMAIHHPQRAHRLRVSALYLAPMASASHCVHA